MSTEQHHELVLVTGMSGGGKSIAMHALEDAGFFCIDNLPPELLMNFLALEQPARGTPGGDCGGRALQGLAAAPAAADQAVARRGPCGPLDLSGRQHRRPAAPLQRDPPPAPAARRDRRGEANAAPPATTRALLLDAIEIERELLAALRVESTVIDTSLLRPAQLRTWVRDLVTVRGEAR